MTIIINVPTHEQITNAAYRAELGLGELFSIAFKDSLIFEPLNSKGDGKGTWFIWRNGRWNEDKSGEVFNIIGNQFSNIFAAAAAYERQQNPDSELADSLWDLSTRCKTRSMAHTVLFWGGKQDKMYIQSTQWDSNPYLLGTRTGVVDLKTGQLKPAKPSDYIKSISPTPFLGLEIKAPRWELFLNEIFDGDSDLVSFMQRLLGYSCSALTVEHTFPILCGLGRNGKSLLIKIVQHVLGKDLAGPVPAEILLDAGKNPNQASPHLMALQYLRIAFCNETNEGVLNSGQVKSLSGGDVLVGRPLYGDVVTFEPRHKLFLVTNVKPYANADDYALWKRIALIEFPLSFVNEPKLANERQADKYLAETLKSEASGILSWLVKGFLSWQTEGLNPPQSVKLATEEYRKNEDSILQFLQDEMEEGEDKEIKSSTLYEYYENWTKANGIRRVLGSKKFYQKIAAKFEKVVKNDGTYYQGLEPKKFVFSFTDEKQRQDLEKRKK